MHIWVHIWARAIWSSGVSLKRSCKMQFRRVGHRSIGHFSQKLWPNLISRIIKLVPHLSRVQNICLWKVRTLRQQNRQKMLRAIASSKTYMSPQMYMKAITLFIANLNITGNRLKQDYLRMNNSTGSNNHLRSIDRFRSILI